MAEITDSILYIWDTVLSEYKPLKKKVRKGLTLSLGWPGTQYLAQAGLKILLPQPPKYTRVTRVPYHAQLNLLFKKQGSAEHRLGVVATAGAEVRGPRGETI